MKLKASDIEKAIKDSFNDVYRCEYTQRDGWSPKQLQFIRLLTKRLQGKEVDVAKVSSVDKIKASIDFRCPTCNKKCKSRSGITLHMQRCNG